ncbi:hypothetical protein [Pseudomonas sp. S31]|uniref:hypothetical protein n=1 Tax=Pseudomonas sp. S31 TaxID=1564473 RepID=UPI0019131A32|nr:hypothetical protein [Pseudomonas sp. S31]
MRERLVNKIIAHLKFEINSLQAEALSASSARDHERCRKALRLQTNAIEYLIKAVDAKRRIAMQR